MIGAAGSGRLARRHQVVIDRARAFGADPIRVLDFVDSLLAWADAAQLAACAIRSSPSSCGGRSSDRRYAPDAISICSAPALNRPEPARFCPPSQTTTHPVM
jgi:hypothetical protein